jgi:hypothetical protein
MLGLVKVVLLLKIGNHFGSGKFECLLEDDTVSIDMGFSLPKAIQYQMSRRG